MARMNIKCSGPKPLAAVGFAMVFERPPSSVMLGASLLGFLQGVQKLRPILRPLEHRRCLPQLVECLSVCCPQSLFLLAGLWRSRHI
jgi:hypothetical protein